jgi:hypothetical protein
MGTDWEAASEWRVAGRTRTEIEEGLRARGVDAEGARVLTNALFETGQPQLVDASFTLSTNTMLPKAFAVSELGLSGPPVLVSVYWLVFGVATLTMVGVMMLASAASARETYSALEQFAARWGLVVGLLALIWGLVRLGLIFWNRRRASTVSGGQGEQP